MPLTKDRKGKENPPGARETPLTYEDYAQTPDDGQRYELVDGQLEWMTAPGRTHQIVSRRLVNLLSRDCESQYEIVCAPVDVVLSATEVRQPDLVMIDLRRLTIYKERGNIVEPPDLVVEILSPSTRKQDKIVKHQAYAKFGVPEYWIVNPDDGTLEQHRLGPSNSYVLADIYADDEAVASDLLSCVSFTMNDVMERVRNLPPA